MRETGKSVKEFLKTKKGKAAAGGGAAAAAVAVVAIGLLLSGQGYRTIAVQEVNGTSIIRNEKQESSDAYAGMHLHSGDDVTVQEASDMTLLLDMDKYVYAEENTHFWLEAEGDGETGKTCIHLAQGAELNRLNTKLAAGETYEVDTPNSVMAVRGTVFRVSVSYDNDGLAWTSLEVYDGNVEVTLKTLEGEFNGVSEVFGAGESTLIRASSDFSEFVVGEEHEVKYPIDYKALPPHTALKLVEFIDAGDKLCIGKELLEDYTGLKEHQIEEVITREASCSQEGTIELRCTVCNEVEGTAAIPSLPHEAGDWEIVREPDCVHAGLEQKVCAVCGQVMATRKTAAPGHTSGAFVVTTEATCTHTGERVKRCTVCGAILQREVIAAFGHTAGDWTELSPATCTAGGQLSRVCTRCGVVMETSATAALGHLVGDWTELSPATCTAGGQSVKVCSRCGAVTETSSTAALGHSYGGWTVISRATCQETGSQRRTCSRCGNTETATIAASGHSFGGWTVTSKATCTTAGSRRRTCSVCGKTETSAIAALGHSYGEWAMTKEATCTAAGERSRTCSRCSNTETEETAALGHDYTDWETTREATCVAGSAQRTCRRCNMEETREIPPTGAHQYDESDKGEHDIDGISMNDIVAEMRENKITTVTRTVSVKKTCLNCKESIEQEDKHTITFTMLETTGGITYECECGWMGNQ